MTEAESSWTETDSRQFLDLADVAVPGRREQLEVLVSLVPARPEEPFAAAELCCGEGLLSETLLRRFPLATVLALDRSPAMLERARERLAPFAERAEVRAFDLDAADWPAQLPSPLRCVLSSLAIHHLDDAGKRALFALFSQRLEPGGALLIADIVAPAEPIVGASFVAAWDRAAREQSLALTGSLELYQRAVSEGWRPDYVTAEQGETPGRLFEQLKWLEDAGFRGVDCFWMRAGMAVYGGYR